MSQAPYYSTELKWSVSQSGSIYASTKCHQYFVAKEYDTVSRVWYWAARTTSKREAIVAGTPDTNLPDCLEACLNHARNCQC